jgi:hypothetical protein
MTDRELIESLRAYPDLWNQKAADRIEALNAEVERLTQADTLLRQIHAAVDAGEVDGCDMEWMVAVDEYCWTKQPEAAIVGCANERQGSCRGFKRKEGACNAHDDLLAACKAMIDLEECDIDTKDVYRVIEAARAAVKKAEGE